MDQTPSLDRGFVRRSLFLTLLAVLVFIAWQLASVILMAFGAVIVAVLLRSLADPIRDRTPLNDGLALGAAALIIVGVLAGSAWLFGATVSGQVQALVKLMPTSMAELRQQVATLPFGAQIAPQLQAEGLFSQLGGVAGRIGGYAMNLASAMTNLLLVIFAGIYLAIRPQQSRDGFLSLIPRGPREPVGEAMNASGLALRRWLLGTLADMVVVGVLTGLGTWMIGLPSPLALGLFAGLAAFVPIVGPIVSVIPGVLLALPLGPEMVMWTVLVYFGVQQVESNLFYPFVQRWAVDLPPVLTLVGVLGFGTLLGALGVLFATPLLVVLLVAIKLLYLRNTLGEDPVIPGMPRRPDGAAAG